MDVHFSSSLEKKIGAQKQSIKPVNRTMISKQKKDGGKKKKKKKDGEESRASRDGLDGGGWDMIFTDECSMGHTFLEV